MALAPLTPTGATTPATQFSLYQSSEETSALHNFTPDAAADLGGPDWLVKRRVEAAEDLLTMPMPSEKEEIWRYSPIDDLDLDRFAPIRIPSANDGGGGDVPPGLATRFGLPAASIVITNNGSPVVVDRTGLPRSVRLRTMATSATRPATLGSVLQSTDALVRMNDAFQPGGLVLEVPAGVHMPAPVVFVHWCDLASTTAPGDQLAPAIFPRTAVRIGKGATAQVVEVVAGLPGESPALVVPVTELRVAEGGDLSYVSVQQLGPGAWHIARLAADVGRDARVRTFTVGLGAAYDRCRTDAVASGQGALTELRSAYFGSDKQIHDVRTVQEHAAPRTTSDLLCKGAVAQESRSIYSGLIHIRHGATRSNAMQTNHNLVLDERAHADSVPNLDIEENDVRCSHASSVGPIDEDQRYYIESRGIAPDRAERLIVLGFFNDIIDRSPVPAATSRLREQIGQRVVRALSSQGRKGEIDHDG